MTTPVHLQQLYTVLANIPAGRVVSYGQLAELAGKPGAARWVGQSLGKLPEDSRLPWFRVVNAKGAISFPAGSNEAMLQVQLLHAEGIEVSARNTVDLKRYGLFPTNLFL